jgi:hypothetical protein
MKDAMESRAYALGDGQGAAYWFAGALMVTKPGSTDSRRANWGPGARAGGSAPRTGVSIAIAL